MNAAKIEDAQQKLREAQVAFSSSEEELVRAYKLLRAARSDYDDRQKALQTAKRELMEVTIKDLGSPKNTSSLLQFEIQEALRASS